MIDGRHLFDQSVKKDKRTYENIRDSHLTGSLLDCIYFKENYKLIIVDLSK